MKMQVRHEKARLHFMCDLHMIWTWRAKLALLGYEFKVLARRRSDAARCATCIFNFHRGPHSILYAEIYSELCLGARYGVQRLGRSLKINIGFVLRCSAILQQHVNCTLTATSSPPEGVRCDGWAQHHSETNAEMQISICDCVLFVRQP